MLAFWSRYVHGAARAPIIGSNQSHRRIEVHVVLKHQVNRVKNGYAARSPLLGLSAHGPTPDLAARNLERLVGLYLRPFERQGTLREEIQLAGLSAEESEGELTVEAAN
jgi:hypothetical protein